MSVLLMYGASGLPTMYFRASPPTPGSFGPNEWFSMTIRTTGLTSAAIAVGGVKDEQATVANAHMVTVRMRRLGSQHRTIGPPPSRIDVSSPTYAGAGAGARRAART